LIEQILGADLYSGRYHRLRRASTSSAMANELVKPGLSMPNKFMNPGYPSSMRITKSWNLEPAGTNLGLKGQQRCGVR
jgi:hypothetical protein